MMLIDHIDPQKLPWIVVWLDWCVYAWWPSLIVSCASVVSHWWLTTTNHSIAALTLPVFVGFCAWVLYCAVRQGYAVG